jgi:protein transport protein SEC31
LEDCEKRLSVLFDKLNNKEISDVVTNKLLDLSRLIESKDYRSAGDMHVSMMTSHFEEVGSWMIGLKRIVDILSRHITHQ